MTATPIDSPASLPVDYVAAKPANAVQPIATVLVPMGELAPPESLTTRLTYLTIALGLTAFYFLFHATYLVPAHSGVDQNGYLVGGRMIYHHGTMKLDGFNPDTQKVDPYMFVGRMWVGADLGTDEQRFYPKYPIGLPALVGLSFKIGGPTYGPIITYWINPVCMSLAILATFLLIRIVAGSFAAIIGALVIGIGPVCMGLATNPNSHASTLFFVTWGMYLLVRWWQQNSNDQTDSRHPLIGALSALGAGFLIGYAATIRYTEALLILPILMVAIFNYRPRSRRSLIESGLLLAGWAIPVIGLVCYNLAAMNALTGYDPTNESTGFSWDYFGNNWHTMLHQIHDTGLVFVFPIALIGMVFMFAWNWRVALFMALWAIPATLTYTFYYWAPDGSHIGYLRFFLTVFPPYMLCAFWALSRLRISIGSTGADPLSQRITASIATGLIAAASIGLSFPSALSQLDSDQHNRMVLNFNTQQIVSAMQRVEPNLENAIIFANDDSMLHHLQFVTGARCYTNSAFGAPMQKFSPDPDAPQGLDPARLHDLMARGEAILKERLNMSMEQIEAARRLRNVDAKQLSPDNRRLLETVNAEIRRIPLEERRNIISAAIAAGHPVFLVGGAAREERRGDRGGRDDRVPSAERDDGLVTKMISSWSTSIPAPQNNHGKGGRNPNRRRGGGGNNQPQFVFNWNAPRPPTSQVLQVVRVGPLKTAEVVDPATYLNQPRPTAKPKPF